MKHPVLILLESVSVVKQENRHESSDTITNSWKYKGCLLVASQRPLLPCSSTLWQINTGKFEVISFCYSPPSPLLHNGNGCHPGMWIWTPALLTWPGTPQTNTSLMRKQLPRINHWNITDGTVFSLYWIYCMTHLETLGFCLSARHQRKHSYHDGYIL